MVFCWTLARSDSSLITKPTETRMKEIQYIAKEVTREQVGMKEGVQDQAKKRP